MDRKATVSEELRHFVMEYADDDYAASLIIFFAAYPFTRFSRLAIVHALNPDNCRNQVHEALEKLVDKGIINTRVDNGTALYWLIDNSATRRLVLQFGRLAMSPRRLQFRHTSSSPSRIKQPFAGLSARLLTPLRVS